MKKRIMEIGLITILMSSILLTGCSDTDTSSSTSSNTCSICGGKIICAVCGSKDALYCENASYGAGKDHFCNKHWPDVVAWHENK